MIGWMSLAWFLLGGFSITSTAVDDGSNGEVECYILDYSFPPMTEEEYNHFL